MPFSPDLGSALEEDSRDNTPRLWRCQRSNHAKLRRWGTLATPTAFRATTLRLRSWPVPLRSSRRLSIFEQKGRHSSGALSCFLQALMVGISFQSGLSWGKGEWLTDWGRGLPRLMSPSIVSYVINNIVFSPILSPSLLDNHLARATRDILRLALPARDTQCEERSRRSRVLNFRRDAETGR